MINNGGENQIKYSGKKSFHCDACEKKNEEKI